MSPSTPPDCQPKSTSTLPEQPGVLVVRKHHFLVRWSHWLNVPILLVLILSGISIHWASPICQHKPDPNTENTDVAADIGIWICAHVPGQHNYSTYPKNQRRTRPFPRFSKKTHTNIAPIVTRTSASPFAAGSCSVALDVGLAFSPIRE